MRFPAGLRARLLRRGFLQAFAPHSPAIFHLSPMVRHSSKNSAPAEAAWHSPAACVRAAAQAHAAAVWLSGTEPLLHPAIGEVTSALAQNGFYVFLHTSGLGLRQRIHEIVPVDRLFLALEVPTNDSSSPAQLLPSVAVSSVHETMRVARLSGFNLCAHLTVSEALDVSDFTTRIRDLQSRGIDGLAASSQDRRSPAALGAAVGLIPSSAWRQFSRSLQSSYEQAAPAGNALQTTQAQPAECEESA